jgi:predicted transcriptional regulator of viral defense system
MHLTKREYGLVEKISKYGLLGFSPATISKLEGIKPEAARMAFKRLERKGAIKRIKKGVYALSETSEFGAICDSFSPAYVSGWSALSYRGITEQTPQNKTEIVSTVYRRHPEKIILHKIDRKLFVGYEDAGFPLAKTEKAVFDALWFNSISVPVLKEMAQGLNRKDFEKYLERIRSAKKKKIMQKKIRGLFL